MWARGLAFYSPYIMTVRRWSHKVRGVQCPGPRDQRGHAGCMAALSCVSMAGHNRARARDTVTRELELETLSLSDGTTCREAADTLLPLRPPRTLYTATAAGNAGNPYSTVQCSTNCTRMWEMASALPTLEHSKR